MTTPQVDHIYKDDTGRVLHVFEVDETDRLGRQVRGIVSTPVKGGTPDVSRYATDIPTFDKVWSEA